MSIEAETQQLRDRMERKAASSYRQKRRNLFDRLARWAVATGGFAIIASILLILLFIFIEILPLFSSARVDLIRSRSIHELLANAGEHVEQAVALAAEENQEVGAIATAAGSFQFFSLADWKPLARFSVDLIAGDSVTAVWQALSGEALMLATAQGRVAHVELLYNVRFYEGERTYRPVIRPGSIWPVDLLGQPIVDIAVSGDPEESMALAAVTVDGRIILYTQAKESSIFGEGEVDSIRHELPQVWVGQPRKVVMDGDSRNLFMGTDRGRIYHWSLSADGPPQFVTSKIVTNETAIADMRFLLGGRTLIIADADGGSSAWFLVRDNTATTGKRLTRIRGFKSHSSAVTAITPSARGKGFISADSTGTLFLHHSTSERFLADFSLPGNRAARIVTFAPKANGALVLDSNGDISHWKIENPHPEASVKAFFGKVWYEGYDQPEYVWQSTGGTDEFEPKLSLVPLIFGSLKGTFYALLFAIPLAILAALYTSQFMHPTWRNKVKPTIEIMAALPSVVLGFLGGLWLAPRIEQVVPAVLSTLLVLPLLILIISRVWVAMPLRHRNRFRPGVESLILLPVIILGVWLCIELNGLVESLLFKGDFKAWLYGDIGLAFDQRNALVVGFAMGFAVIPIIYTISEDALSNVPQTLISGSLALGATRWQTAIRVVIPTAAAGIFSAVMIGLGRAVGETMIVLMATGNTPIMEWNIFNGFRTLSANIAVEIPEAPLGGTLYRVLFMAAMLLFIITFIVNTLAELVRQRLRAKYQRL